MLEQRVTSSRTYTIITSVLFGLVISLVGGFLWFLSLLPLQETDSQQHADGIVVLTGGDFRVRKGLQLLSEGRAKRLLVTSEPPSASLSNLSALVPGFDRLIGCCVDIDYVAANTAGNALAACQWTKGLGFKSLIIVTSNYHMTRALAEFQYRHPHVQLIAAPVVNGQWGQLSIVEYIKFLLTKVRTPILALFEKGNTACSI